MKCSRVWAIGTQMVQGTEDDRLFPLEHVEGGGSDQMVVLSINVRKQNM